MVFPSSFPVKIFLLAVITICTHGLIQDLPMSNDMCTIFKMHYANSSDVPAHDIQYSAISHYLCLTAANRHYVDIQQTPEWQRETKKYIDWIDSYIFTKRRKKRQAVRRRRYVRQEIRMLSNEQRFTLFNALNQLKRDRRLQPNVYDAIAAFHQGPTIQLAHFGAAFLPWHRIFLLRLEFELRRINNTIALPYWDSTCDDPLDDPALSIIWTPEFLGNAFGRVNTGFMRGWRTEDGGGVIRNVGFSGSLMQEGQVNRLIQNANSQVDIIFRRGGNLLMSLEGLHNSVHNFVGGTMGGLNTAPFDFIFFLHHCYIDYIWERVRRRLSRLGVNVENDYPTNNPPGHEPLSPMANFRFLRNIDGFLNFFTDQIYRYQRSPRCTLNNRDCGSPYLTCQVRGRRARCVSTRSNYVNDVSPEVRQAATRLDMRTRSGPRFQSASIDPRARIRQWASPNVRSNTFDSTLQFPRPAGGFQDFSIGQQPRSSLGTPWTFQTPVNSFPDGQIVSGTSLIGTPQHLIRKKRQAFMPHLPPLPPLPPQPSPFLEDLKPLIYTLDKTIQNSYGIDGVSDMRKWCIITVRIVYMRPPAMKFNAEPTVDDNSLQNVDFYDPNLYPSLKSNIQTMRLPSYRKRHSGSGAAMVFIKSDGISYSGTFTEYVTIDERLPATEAIGYIAVKDPQFQDTLAYLSAFDSYGRVCQPRCVVSNSYENYRPCSGLIRLSSQAPKMYSSTLGEAIKDRWNFDDKICPRSKTSSTFITFVCDYQDRPYWLNCGSDDK